MVADSTRVRARPAGVLSDPGRREEQERSPPSDYTLWPESDVTFSPNDMGGPLYICRVEHSSPLVALVVPEAQAHVSRVFAPRSGAFWPSGRGICTPTIHARAGCLRETAGVCQP